MTHVLAIDQGTTSSRAIVFDERMSVVASAQEEFPQHFPQSGWVEHDPADIWASTAAVCRAAIERAGVAPGGIAAIGITNQRETTLVWDRETGQPLGRAIVWQDRRTSELCAELKRAGHEAMVTAKTGLLLDPYFSGTKLKWLLDAHDGARAMARERAAPLRHGRHLADLEAERRRDARHRRHQRGADAALQHPRRGAGTRTSARSSTSPWRCCPRSRDSRRRLRRSPAPTSSARRCRSWAWPATSRRRRSGRLASPRGC